MHFGSIGAYRDISGARLQDVVLSFTTPGLRRVFNKGMGIELKDSIGITLGNSGSYSWGHGYANLGSGHG